MKTTLQNHQRINLCPGRIEYGAPEHVIEAARVTMGAIDLDPFSSHEANSRVNARYYYTAESAELDGLTQRWFGRVWMWPPLDAKNNDAYIFKLLKEYQLRHITEACLISFASTSEAWFRPLLDHPQCFLFPRTNYTLPDGTPLRGVTKGSVVTYLGPNLAKFARAFRLLGTVKVAYSR